LRRRLRQEERQLAPIRQPQPAVHARPRPPRRAHPEVLPEHEQARADRRRMRLHDPERAADRAGEADAARAVGGRL
jgi:hypothetical protein